MQRAWNKITGERWGYTHSQLHKHYSGSNTLFGSTNEQLTDKEAVTEFALAKNPVGRKILFDQARKQLHKQTRGNYPAQDLIIDGVKAGLEGGFEAGLAAEARAFGRLLTTNEAANLMSLFFATTALKKDSGVDDPSVKPREISKVGMLGAAPEDQLGTAGRGRVILDEDRKVGVLGNGIREIEAPPKLHLVPWGTHRFRPVPKLEGIGDTDAGDPLPARFGEAREQCVDA